MHYYRDLGKIGSISAINIAQSSKGSPNPARPTPLDFRCDVEKVIKKIIPAAFLARFFKAYIFLEAADSIEQEKWADKVLGGIRHSFEQRMGEQFIERKLHPVQGRGYFHCIRKARKK
ncbi:MAG: hypothetical protein C5B59_06705 [Bacteroidetes bacterium]|nr:MAG: hypothetical protein C5B59_06705 [Bacteroidota bacterium]